MALFLAGCEEAGPDEPQIFVDANPVILGRRLVDPDATARQFSLQFVNRGVEALQIDDVQIVGDARCSFAFLGPDVTEVAQDGAMFMRGEYLPTEVGDDQIAVVVYSNASNFPELVVPVCGVGVASLDDPETEIVCEAPPEAQADCPF